MSGESPPLTPDEHAPTVLDTPDAGPAAIRGAGLRVVSYGAGTLLSVGSAALLFRHLGVSDSGRYVTVLSLVTIVAGLTDWGLTTIGLREVSEGSHALRGRFIASLLGLRLILTVLAVAGAVAFALAAGYDARMVAGTAIVGASLVIQNIQSTVAIVLMSDLRLGWVALADFARQAALVVLVIAFVAAGFGLVPFYAASIPAAAAGLGVTLLGLPGDARLRFSFDSVTWRRVLRDTLPFAAATAVSAVYFRVAIILMSLIATAHETGYFGASFRIIEVLVIVPLLVVGAGFPILARAARTDRQRVAYGITRMWEVSVALGTGLFVVLFVGAPFVIRVVAGPKFGPSVGVLRIQSLGLLASFAASAWAYGLLALRMHREVLAVTLAAFVVTTALTAALVGPLGAEGGAIATTVSEAFLAVVIPWVLVRAHAEMRPTSRYVPRILAAGLAAAALRFVPGLPSAALMALAAAVYLGALFALRALPEELIEQLREYRRALRARRGPLPS